jgi:hypothetical protein
MPDLKCPYCGGYVVASSNGDSIYCGYDASCGAEWDGDGTLRTAGKS